MIWQYRNTYILWHGNILIGNTRYVIDALTQEVMYVLKVHFRVSWFQWLETAQTSTRMRLGPLHPAASQNTVLCGFGRSGKFCMNQNAASSTGKKHLQIKPQKHLHMCCSLHWEGKGWFAYFWDIIHVALQKPKWEQKLFLKSSKSNSFKIYLS